MNGSATVLVILAIIAFTAGVCVAVLLAASRRNEKRSGHQPAHRR